MIAPIRLGVSRSPRKIAARMPVQAGAVNSSANTVASGSNISPFAHANWAA